MEQIIVKQSKPKPNIELKESRMLLGWSQEKVAEKIGTDPKRVGIWERGESIPSPHFQEKLCKLFGKNAKELGFVSSQEVSPDSETNCGHEPSDQSAIFNPSRMRPQDPSSIQVIQIYGPHNKPLLSVKSPASTSIYLQPDGIVVSNIDALIRVEYVRQRQTERDKELNEDTDSKLSRRHFLELFAGLPVFSSSSVRKLLYDDEVLSLAATQIPILWRLYFDGYRAEVETVLPEYLTQLTALAEQSSPLQKHAASLASQVSQLSSMFALHQEDFITSLAQCQRAIQYAQVAGDMDVLIAAFMRKVNTLYYRKHHRQVTQTLQEAAQYTNSVSPLMRSRIFSELAADMALYGRDHDFDRYGNLALESFPSQPESDPSFKYTYTNYYILHLNEALAYLDLEKPEEAWKAIEKTARYVPDALSSRRVELLIHQITIAVARRNFEETCDLLGSALDGSQQLNSALRFHDASEVYYQKIPIKWKNEPRLRQIAERFQLL